jgi:hypothetical protein
MTTKNETPSCHVIIIADLIPDSRHAINVRVVDPPQIENRINNRINIVNRIYVFMGVWLLMSIIIIILYYVGVDGI